MSIKDLEKDAIKGLNRIHKVYNDVKIKEPEVKALCNKCEALRSHLKSALWLIDKIPVYGVQIGSAVRLLAKVAEMGCAELDGK